MKNWKHELLEGVKAFGTAIAALTLIFLIFVGLVKWSRWQEKRSQSHEINASKVTMYLSADGGYYFTRETVTHVYGSGDTVTTRSLRLIPAKNNTFFGDSTTFTDISVWDYTTDGKWDKMFLCGYPNDANGCNAILFNGELQDWRQWEWDPCPADENMKPFDGAVVTHVVGLIKEAGF